MTDPSEYSRIYRHDVPTWEAEQREQQAPPEEDWTSKPEEESATPRD